MAEAWEEEEDRGRTVRVVFVLAVAGLLAALAYWLGVEATIDLLRTGFVGLLYVLVPLALVGGLVGLFFRFNAWRR